MSQEMFCDFGRLCTAIMLCGFTGLMLWLMLITGLRYLGSRRGAELKEETPQE